jgi:hypothetical protein
MFANNVIISEGYRSNINRRLANLGEAVVMKDPSTLYRRLLDGEEIAVKETMEILFEVVDLTDKVKELNDMEEKSILN